MLLQIVSNFPRPVVSNFEQAVQVLVNACEPMFDEMRFYVYTNIYIQMLKLLQNSKLYIKL